MNISLNEIIELCFDVSDRPKNGHASIDFKELQFDFEYVIYDNETKIENVSYTCEDGTIIFLSEGFTIYN